MVDVLPLFLADALPASKQGARWRLERARRNQVRDPRLPRQIIDRGGERLDGGGDIPGGVEREAFDAVPFFWSQHYDVPINYVGHAEKWDEIAIDGDIAAKDCLLRYKRNGRVLAVASIYRDLASLEAELAMEQVMV